MNAICICGSPRKEGSTAMILGEVARALRDSGLSTTTHFISELQVGHCCGHKYCEISGECVQRDDVQSVVADIASARLVVLASPSYWGDITGQLKMFIDRCTPYCNMNPSRTYRSSGTMGAAIAIRAGNSRAENERLIHTMEHFLGHLDIPLLASFTAEGIDKPSDLSARPDLLTAAYAFGQSLAASL